MRRSADWCGLGTGVVRRVVRAANSGLHASCILRLLRISKLANNQSKSVFDLKLLVGGALHKVVLDHSGFRVYCLDVDWVLNFLFILSLFYLRFWVSLPSCANIQRSPFLFLRMDHPCL